MSEYKKYLAERKAEEAERNRELDARSGPYVVSVVDSDDPVVTRAITLHDTWDDAWFWAKRYEKRGLGATHIFCTWSEPLPDKWREELEAYANTQCRLDNQAVNEEWAT